MSGLLRRIKRSRPADAGEPLPEGQAAAPEGAAPATEPATAVTEPVAYGPQPEPTPQPVAYGPQPEPTPQPEPKTETPVLLADPNTPADVDPAAAPMRPPAGRRGRLRRRLRYLRRARELMLRDLGGLLYEVHRTGGGNVEAHGNIVRAKVQRIAGLDAEAHALESALATSRPEAVVFQPGVGGACPACGEYYGSAARFCSNCGTPIGGSALPAPADDPAITPAPATRESVFGRPSPPTPGLSSGDPLRTTAPENDQPTAALGSAAASAGAPATQAPGAPTAEEPDAGQDTAVLGPTGERGEATSSHIDAGAASDAGSDARGAIAGDEPAALDPAAGDDPAVAASKQPGGSDDLGASGEPGAPRDHGGSGEPDARQDLGGSGEPAASDDAATTAPATSDDAAALDAAASDAPAARDDQDEPAASDAPAARDDQDEPAASDAPADDPQRSDRPDDAGRNPFARLDNGRAEDGHDPPELSSGDPLATRDTRS